MGISAAVFAVVLLVRCAGGLESLELSAYDGFMRLRPAVSRVDSRVALVGISDADIQSQASWPLTDAVLSETLRALLRHRPRAIGLDIFRDIPVPPGTEAFESLLKQNRNIVGAMKFGDDGVLPPAVLKETEQVGFNDILVDPGGIVRRGLLFLDDERQVYSSLALRLALLYLKGEGISALPDPSEPTLLRLGKTTLRPFRPNDGGYVRADARGYQFLLDYQGADGAFPALSLASLSGSEIDPEAFRDKVVLIGVRAESVKDLFYTPQSRGRAERQQLAGIDLHAHMVSQLLRHALDGTPGMAALSEGQEALWNLLWAVTGGLLGLRTLSVWRFSSIWAGGSVALLLGAYVPFLRGLWVPWVPAALCWSGALTAVTAYLSNLEKRQRDLLMRLFSQHVSPEIAEAIWQNRDEFLRGGRPRSQKMPVTVLFSDLEGYTTVSENMKPQDLMDWLNTYLEAMAALVMEYSGVVDDYAGDGIKANFGVPFPRLQRHQVRQDAVNAVHCALAMGERIEQLNTAWTAETPAGRAGADRDLHRDSDCRIAGKLKTPEVYHRRRHRQHGRQAGKLRQGPRHGEALSHFGRRHHLGAFGGGVPDRTDRDGRVERKEPADHRLPCFGEAGFSQPGSSTGGGIMKIGPAAVAWIGIALLAPVLCMSGTEPNAEENRVNQVLPQGPVADPAEGMARPGQPGEKHPSLTLDLPVYRPPMWGAPKGRVAGGTRGSTGGVTSLYVLAPDHQGWSSKSQPCLYWFLSELTDYPIEFTLVENRAVRPLVEIRVDTPRRAGIQPIRLADHDVHLEPDVPYRWFIAVVRDVHNRSKDLLAGGTLCYREQPQDLRASLARAGADKAVHVYARAGFWYDALQAVCERLKAQPHDKELRLIRVSLLEQVGLNEVARWDADKNP